MYEASIRRAEARIAEAQRELDRLARLEAEAMEKQAKYLALKDAEDGTVIVFEYRFTTFGPIYSYAALCYGGLWNTTGPRSPKAFNFEELCTWFHASTKPVEVYVVTEIEELDS
jgi:hypothetical protein